MNRKFIFITLAGLSLILSSCVIGSPKPSSTSTGGTSSSTGTSTTEPTATVTAISISGTATKTTYISGQLFDPSGLTVTATYSNSTSGVVSNSSCVWTDNSHNTTTLVIGTTVVKCSYEGKTATYGGISVVSGSPYEKTNIQKTYTDYNNNNVYNLDNCPTTGTPKLLIIPIWFTDSSTYITSTTNKSNVLSDIKTAYLGTVAETGWNSVKSFYETESAGNITLTGTVSSWYECGSASSAYYTDSGSTTTDLVTSATNWYFTNNSSDSRTNYDSDKDGYLDGAMLIYGAPDYSALGNSDADNLWAYCYWMQDTSAKSTSSPGANVFFWASYDFMYNSAKASSRAGTSYSHGDCSHATVDAHTFIHEMGHVFGLEDYYDYSGQYQPAGSFSMQDYNVGGHDPYSVMAYGWADPYIPAESCSITINPFQSSHDMILLTPSWNSYNSPFDEYFLLELYTPTGLNEFDSTYQYGSSYPKGPATTGIRLWHVDARLAYRVSGSYSTSRITTNPNISSYKVTHAISNTYYKSSVSGYCSPLGTENSDYYDYNILQLIRKNTSATYKQNTSLASSDLFVNGSSFNMSTYSTQFVNGTTLNNGSALGWSFSVSISGSGALATATVSLTKA